MSLYYTKSTLHDLEIKIHDARRKIDNMIEMADVGVIPSDADLVELNNDLISAVNQLTNYYIDHLNNFPEENIVLETPKDDDNDNVIPFPNKED